MSPDTGNSPPESPPIESSPPPAPLAPLEKRITDLEDQLAKTRDSLAHSERRRDVDRTLVESGAADLEAASALIMERVAHSSNPNIADEVRALKRRKPALFKRSASVASSIGGRDPGDPPPTPIETAAHEAKAGGRAALLRYMRARRAS